MYVQGCRLTKEVHSSAAEALQRQCMLKASWCLLDTKCLPPREIASCGLLWACCVPDTCCSESQWQRARRRGSEWSLHEVPGPAIYFPPDETLGCLQVAHQHLGRIGKLPPTDFSSLTIIHQWCRLFTNLYLREDGCHMICHMHMCDALW